MNIRKAICGSIVILMIVAAAWALGFLGGTDPALAKLEELSEQMFAANSSEASSEELRDRFRDGIRKLSDEQRREFFNASSGKWRVQQERQMNQFFTKSPAEQQRGLDEVINRMLKSRSENPRGTGRGRPGSQRGREGFVGMSEAQRDERAKRRLDRTSATQRAQFTEFRRRLAERAKERGISDLPSRGRRG